MLWIWRPATNHSLTINKTSLSLFKKQSNSILLLFKDNSTKEAEAEIDEINWSGMVPRREASGL